MFCEKCGKANPDDARFCEGCGADLQSEAKGNGFAQVSETFGAAAAAVKNNEMVKKYLPIGIGVIAVAFVLIVLSICGVFKSSAVKTVEKYYKAMVKQDEKAYFTLSTDPVSMEIAIKNGAYEDKEEGIENAKEGLEITNEYLEDEYGEKVKVSFKDMKVSKKYEKKDVKDLADVLEENYGEAGFDAEKLQAVQIVKGKAIFKGKDDKDDSKIERVVIKYDGKWYVNSFSELADRETISATLKADKAKDKEEAGL